MEDEAEVIKHQMEETRTSLSDKLEKLENQVVSTVQQTTDAMSETVESVKEAVQGTVDAVQGTVGAVKDTVQDTVDSVKETMADTVESVRETFDVRRQMEAHPWGMFAGSVAVGFLMGRLVPMPAVTRRHRAPVQGDGKHRARFSYPAAGAAPADPSAMAESSGTMARATDAAASFMSTLADAFAPAIDKLKGMAIGATTGVLGEMIMNAVPDQLKDEVRQAIGDVTTRLGGQQLWKPGEGGLAMPSSSGGAPERVGGEARRWS